MPAAIGELGGGAAVFTAASNSTAAANTVAPGNAATTPIAARAAVPAFAARGALSGRTPPDVQGISLRKEGSPSHPVGMGGA
jgi:hypothetical protein